MNWFLSLHEEASTGGENRLPDVILKMPPWCGAFSYFAHAMDGSTFFTSDRPHFEAEAWPEIGEIASSHLRIQA